MGASPGVCTTRYGTSADVIAAQIRGEVSPTTSVSDTEMGGRIVFATTADDTDTLVDRMTILNNGNVEIGELTIIPDANLVVRAPAGLLLVVACAHAHSLVLYRPTMC